MTIEQIYTGCLAQGAYYITSNGEAAIIDPLREVQPYLDRAAADGVKIKYIFETHFHADFVSGHLDLSQKTEAPIVFGPTANPAFTAIIAHDGEEFKLGNITIKALHTPGHTMESTVYLLRDENGKDHAIFTGDTLFLGDVGRPDLAQKSETVTQEELAGKLYDSLMNKIMPLADNVIVYPAHGAGSACGKNMSKETVGILGEQKATNYALNQPNKEAFIIAVTDGLQAPPAYFPLNVAMNKNGYESLDTIINRGNKPLSADELTLILEITDAIVLDTRTPAEFALGHIPRAINIGITGDFAPWVGALIHDTTQPIVLITTHDKLNESIIRLARVGFDNVLGHLENGFDTWKNADKETDTVNRISAAQFEQEYTANSPVLDVRKDGEYATEHIATAQHLTLSDINNWFAQVDNNTTNYIHCAGGYRSMIAASILKARGVHNFKEVDGGYNAIKNTTLPKAAGLSPCSIK
ncbi:MAG: MBL fold metallo-hydrolase [Bacteroidia bacterium]|nr:MBL fold metallo-hydrolase [Bacteroidia bacterium]